MFSIMVLVLLASIHYFVSILGILNDIPYSVIKTGKVEMKGHF